jgi:DNA-binding XRE family transcriptional regulator
MWLPLTVNHQTMAATEAGRCRPDIPSWSKSTVLAQINCPD